MHRSALVISIILFAIQCCKCQSNPPTTEPAPTENQFFETTTESTQPYIDMEIITIEVLPRLGNAVYLSWGKPLREYSLNWTYGVYYGVNVEEALKEPKLTTRDLYAEIRNLSFCTQYIFAVGVVDPKSLTAHPARNIRTIGTHIDGLAPPQNLMVDFIPDELPCLLAQWSASCPNIAISLGYLITVQESGSPRLLLITPPQSTSVDLAQTLRVIYGKSYDIKVATNVVGSQATAIVSYKVPHFLQPYKVRLTSQPDGAFVMYWREPYVPFYVGDFYYEIYVYPGRDLTNKPLIVETNRPVFQFKGNQSEYTFMVSLRSVDGEFKSRFTEPIVQNVLGDNFTLTVS